MSKRKTRISIKDLSKKSLIESIESEKELKKILGGGSSPMVSGYNLGKAKPI